MEKPFTIFFDLDDALIHSLIERGSLCNGKRIRIQLEDERYRSVLRPSAPQLLADCRALAITKMLTTATKDYAFAHNETFQLGFAPEDIISRDDFLMDIPTPYSSGKDTIAIERNTHRNGVLIDNYPNTNKYLKLKMIFLGIPPENFFQIREFDGQKDPPKFMEKEWPKILSDIKERIPTPPQIAEAPLEMA